MFEGGLVAVEAGEDVVGASQVRDLEKRVRELERLLGRKTMENEILTESLTLTRPKKNRRRRSSPGIRAKTVRDEGDHKNAGRSPLEPDRTARGHPCQATPTGSRIIARSTRTQA